jgi:hypothetical protein
MFAGVRRRPKSASYNAIQYIGEHRRTPQKLAALLYRLLYGGRHFIPRKDNK